jgi:hypothetical protein
MSTSMDNDSIHKRTSAGASRGRRCERLDMTVITRVLEQVGEGAI